MKEININLVIHQFSKEQRIFQSEAQFQFELAWELQKQCDTKPTDGSKVFLELVSAKDTGGKKYYSDIIIRNDVGEYIVIELKYKTKKSEYGEIELLNHGANDLGRFDFLWDLHRIQMLKHCDNTKYHINSTLRTFVAGYAIILTNDEHYWNISKSSFQHKKPLYFDFCIGNGDIIKANTDMKWKDGDNCVRDTWRDCTLSFEKNYEIHWCDYFNEKNREFKYLILDL